MRIVLLLLLCISSAQAEWVSFHNDSPVEAYLLYTDVDVTNPIGGFTAHTVQPGESAQINCAAATGFSCVENGTTDWRTFTVAEGKRYRVRFTIHAFLSRSGEPAGTGGLFISERLSLYTLMVQGMSLGFVLALTVALFKLIRMAAVAPSDRVDATIDSRH